jgi:hypothetical protein
MFLFLLEVKEEKKANFLRSRNHAVFPCGRVIHLRFCMFMNFHSGVGDTHWHWPFKGRGGGLKAICLLGDKAMSCADTKPSVATWRRLMLRKRMGTSNCVPSSSTSCAQVDLASARTTPLDGSKARQRLAIIQVRRRMRSVPFVAMVLRQRR